MFCNESRSILVEWPFNVKPPARSLTWHSETHSHTHTLSPRIYLTALCAPSRTFMTVWFAQTHTLRSVMSVKGSGSTAWADVDSFWVSCLLTGRADADMTTSMWVFIVDHSDQDPVWGVSPVYLYSKEACWQQELGFGPAVQRFVFLSIFMLFHFPKYYLANEKEENYTDLCAWL